MFKNWKKLNLISLRFFLYKLINININNFFLKKRNKLKFGGMNSICSTIILMSKIKSIDFNFSEFCFFFKNY